MSLRRWLPRALAAAGLCSAVLGPASLTAQGVTTGAIAGRVTDGNGAPVASAQVQVRNRATGFSNATNTRDDGRYSVLGLEVGNYDVTIRRIGFAPRTVNAVRVSLSQSTPVDVRLESRAAQLEAVTVSAERNVSGAIIAPSRTGASTTITDSLLSRLPTLDRNFTDFVRLTPQVSSSGPGLSGGGTNNRYNNIQIDGATESDLFGLGSTGQPGGQARGKSIGIESVKEYQVLLSPYDVRQGNFAGVLINAVTKSGANDIFGSVYGFGRSQRFARSRDYISDFDQYQYGFSLGGPIVKDRVLFFVNPEFQQLQQPAAGRYLGGPGSTLRQADLDRFVAELDERGMTNLGGAGRVTNENPLANVFARLDFNVGNTQAMLRHNYGNAEDDIFSRGTTGTAPSFPLGNNGYQFRSVKHATVLQLRTSLANGWFNELLTGYTTIRDERAVMGSLYPQVETTVPGALLIAGAERSSHANELDQDVFEFTNNLTIPLGSHRVTLGTQNQFYRIRNLFGQQRYGRWIFASLADLDAGTPTSYSVGVPLEGDGAVRFSSANHAGYVQDEWRASDRVRVTAGLRLDVPTFGDEPPHNPAVLTEFGRRTEEVPSGNLQWSPRVGFNWDVTGDQRNQLRGGVGMFVGRPAYVWLANAVQNSGLSGYAQLTCGAAQGVPAFTAANVANAPTACGNGVTARAGSEINLLSDHLKFPRNLRATLGYDRDLGAGFVGTFEALYTRGLNSLFYSNIALASQEGTGTGAHGRVVYGDASGNPDRLGTTSRNVVLDVTNHSKDYSYSVTGGVTRRFLDNWEGSLFYTYSRAHDVQSLTSSTANSQYRYGRVVSGAHSALDVTPSRFDQPHRIVASGTYSFAKTGTDLSLIYVGQSGGRYDYIAQADLNGDGFDQNDAVYVPLDAMNPAEIAFGDNTVGGVTYTPAEQGAAFNEFIERTECLRENRGRILPRLACREPFTNRVDVSVRQSLPTFGGQRVSLQLDVINFGNLVNRKWGEVALTSGTPVRLLSSSNTLVGGTLKQGALPLFRFDPTQQRFNADRLASNYQMQLSLRYNF
ncbi:MAG TPA: carboxypeptidase regulatory-like domain-containing protein [Gemmatimonadaceae bacterium]|nr:carboxypeptidase regulatory-like domain-containing protein [Gemmatimonadaceae bacterium]